MSGRRRRICLAADCGNEVASRARAALFCPDHEHDWVAAAEVPLDLPQVYNAHHRSGVQIKEETWVVVRDVYCGQCRQPYHLVKDKACDPFSTVLRGGPTGRRRQDETAEEDAALPAPAATLALVAATSAGTTTAPAADRPARRGTREVRGSDTARQERCPTCGDWKPAPVDAEGEYTPYADYRRGRSDCRECYNRRWREGQARRAGKAAAR